MIYVTDDQSNDKTNPGFKTGIRIGSAKDGKVTAFIPADPTISAPEGITVDNEGNIYGSYPQGSRCVSSSKSNAPARLKLNAPA